jgi:hypothetical protein
MIACACRTDAAREADARFAAGVAPRKKRESARQPKRKLLTTIDGASLQRRFRLAIFFFALYDSDVVPRATREGSIHGESSEEGQEGEEEGEEGQEDDSQSEEDGEKDRQEDHQEDREKEGQEEGRKKESEKEGWSSAQGQSRRSDADAFGLKRSRYAATGHRPAA